ncbi:iron-containing redox enzyme family protein [Micromonospora polyrhachis]|uniref:Quercetin dioxygenase-like cupin family protein/predicted nucleic acid-binding protein n=1 Tax=Micromonospora polyrhachis TaxID=1282883 RepID=A0A7W7SLC2_9ACTN|nr:iron-containing redox enzyme family protein [Micromonospora polyrhachis]MBB4956890.1 quercetin dioxygenase-like cupin family protein/predicted nucleic acid-binding protein [Micromonospora polyrhachis]
MSTGEPHILHGANPYRRMLMPDAMSEVDFSASLGATELTSHRSLAAHRVLGTFYEAETILLPEQGLQDLRTDFDLFYGTDLRRLRESSLSDLEDFAFGFLDDEVDVTGAWTVEALDAYFQHAVAEADAGESPALTAITAARRPTVAADTYLVQLALDGLTEASAMSKNLGGAYGPEQSALFKIFIDEFGYGVHDAKHTTIFAKLLRSRSMASHVHAYWNFYLAAPLATNNYYYYVSRDHAKFFRYVGAVTYAERVFAPSFVKMIATYREVFGDDVDLHYADEHAHIDQHHGRITRDEVLLALAKRHGPGVIPELARGIAEARLLGSWFDEDTAAQIGWADTIGYHRELGLKAAAESDEGRRIDLAAGSPFGTRSHDRTTALVVADGELDLVTTATGEPDRMTRGDAVLIPSGRLYGLQAVSPTCTYEVRPIADQ